MKLQTKLLLVTDSQGNDIDLDEIPVMIKINGKPTDIRLQDIFTCLEFDEGEIYGNSLLCLYNAEDGKLCVEGSEVQLIIQGAEEPVFVRGIKRPSVNDDTVISFEKVKEFAQVFEIAKPDEVFSSLNEEEKQYFIDQRIQHKTKKEQEEQEKLAEQQKQNEEEKARMKAEEEKLKKSIDPRYVHEKKDYISTQRFYAGIDFKEYINYPYHLFYGQDKDQEPTLLIQRGKDWWQECIDFNITDENDKTVTIEFSDSGIMKNLHLNLDSGEITITDV